MSLAQQPPRASVRIGALGLATLAIAFLVVVTLMALDVGRMASNDALEIAKLTGYTYSQETVQKLSDAFGKASTLAQVLEAALADRQKIDRSLLDQVFIQTVKGADLLFFGAWAVFEPGRLDGRDQEYAGKPGYGPQGDYVPYAYRRAGQIVFKHDPFTGEKNRDYYVIPRRTGRPVLIDPYTDPTAENAMMTSVAVPIRSGNEIVGVTGVDVLLESFGKAVSSLRFGRSGYVFLVGNNGMVVGHSRPELRGRRLTDAALGFSTDVLEAIRGGYEFREQRLDPLTGVETFFQYVPVRVAELQHPWSLAIAVPVDEILEKPRALTFKSGLVGVGSFALLCFVIYFLTRSIVQPLRRSERGLREIFDHVTSAITIHSREGRIRDANDKMLALFGLTKDELLRLDSLEALSDSDSSPKPPGTFDSSARWGSPSERLARHWAKVESEGPQAFEWRARRPGDGTTFETEVFLSRAELEGEPVILATIRDVTTRKQAERERRHHAHRMERQLGAMARMAASETLWTGKSTEAVPALSELVAETVGVERVGVWLLDQSRQSVRCLDLYEHSSATHSQEAAWLRFALEPELEVLGKGRYLEVSDVTADARAGGPGAARFVGLGVKSVLDVAIRESGLLAGILCIEHVGPVRAWFRDEIVFACAVADQIGQVFAHEAKAIAEEARRKLELKMQQAQKLESLGVLAGGIAHDFNNLLMAMLGHAELARDEVPAESSVRADLETIIEAVKRAADLCRHMLAYSGQGKIEIRRIDLGALVGSMVRLLEHSITKKAELTLDLARDLPGVEADQAQIQQVVMNLVLNASESLGDSSGHIRVSTGLVQRRRESLFGWWFLEPALDQDYVSLVVADDGCGMAPDAVGRIFDPFFSTKFTGRGLGLAAVLGIVRSHRGAIRVDSEPGHGTTFTVLLPAADRPGEPAATVGRGVQPGHGRGNVLLADDEELVRAVGRRLLEKMGFTVVTASNGEEAVELFRQRPDDFVVVILDFAMPRLDGIQALEQLRRLRPSVRAIIATGYGTEDVTALAKEGSIGGILHKPYEAQELQEQLERVLQAG